MWSSLKEVIAYRSMLWSLTQSELRTRYKGSLFGFLWTFLNPLLTLLVYSLIFSTVMKVNIPHYTTFLFVGLLAWNLFAISLQSSAGVVVRQSSLVKKIYFPRHILPLSVVIGSLINYFLSSIILASLLLVTGFHPTLLWLCIPPVVLIEAIVTAGFSLLFSAINVYFRDTEHMLGILLMLWFYLTPVVYPLSMVPKHLEWVFKLNPIGDIILFIQGSLYYNQLPHLKLIIYTVCFSIFIFVFGWVSYQRLSRRFAEEV